MDLVYTFKKSDAGYSEYTDEYFWSEEDFTYTIDNDDAALALADIMTDSYLPKTLVENSTKQELLKIKIATIDVLKEFISNHVDLNDFEDELKEYFEKDATESYEESKENNYD